MAYAAINNCAACSCLEKSDKIIMAQMWVKTSSVCVCVCFLWVAYSRNRPLRKIIVANRVSSCSVRLSEPPDTVNTHSVFLSKWTT